MDEQVVLYDEQGRPCGSAPRWRMRAENLRHAATAVIVRDSWGRVYVHRRTDTKDVFPGMHDFAAGGVLVVGENPAEAAQRELAEELGITGVELTPIGEFDYADEHTNYRAFVSTTTWDGPVMWQPSEVAWGDWVTLEELADRLAEPGWCVPDTAAVAGPWIAERIADVVEPEQGWDCHTRILEGRWVDRRPRRPEVQEWLLAETELMPGIADRFEVTVPRPIVVRRDPLTIRHALVPGVACDPARLGAGEGAAVGGFLRALHDLERSSYVESGVPLAPQWRERTLAALSECRERVLPLLEGADRRAGQALLADLTDVVADGPATLIHSDLGPAHLLVDPESGAVSGVIDWCDAAEGDPALDLSWVLHGPGTAFTAAAADAYGADAQVRHRSLLWHRFGPWHEVLYGLTEGPDDFIASGLAGLRDRLPG